MPDHYRAKLFWTGGSQAVRLPKECRFPKDAGEVVVSRDGKRVALEASDGWSPAVWNASDDSTKTFRRDAGRTAECFRATPGREVGISALTLSELRRGVALRRSRRLARLTFAASNDRLSAPPA